MRKLLLLIALTLTLSLGCTAQQKVSILGDSYSTFKGAVLPEWNLVWYDGERADNDVSQPEQTWWSLLIDQQGWALEKNNSFSGATVCCTGYQGRDFSDRAFLTRAYDLGSPDIILVLGGTNDSWARSPVGEYKYGDWNKEDLYAFRPAFAYLMQELQQLYPNARIVNIVNSELSDDVTTSMQTICDHYGITNVQLQDIDKQQGHPSQAGMCAIASQVADAIK